jgi:DNA-binding CsgD family transcriptional regulator
MIRRQLTVAERLKIAALSKSGKRQRAIARELNLDIRQVRRFQRENGLPIPTNGLAPDLIEKIIEMAKQGMPQIKIARRLQVNVLTIAKYLRAAGLPTHPAPLVVPEKVEAEVVDALRRGLSQRQVALRVPLSLFYIRKIASSRRAA